MELFESGGLMQEGGTVDPVSGNDVPTGSTKEEVRDDIPAQLSEGEFVMPADVVRYHGLDKMMALRDEAKIGLQRMEDMGQMGNSDEAIIPEDIPFSIDDIDIEDNDNPEYNVGGYVPPDASIPPGIPTPREQVYGLSTQQSAFNQYAPQYTPYTAPSMPTAETPGYKPPTQQNVPMAPTVDTFPTFGEVVTPSTTDVRKYVNEQGLELMIPFVNGQPVYPIPVGYKPFEEKTETTTAPSVESVAQQSQEEGGDSSTDSPVVPKTEMDKKVDEVTSTDTFQEINAILDKRTGLEKLGDTAEEIFANTLVGKIFGVEATTNKEYEKQKRELAVSVANYSNNPVKQKELLSQIKTELEGPMAGTKTAAESAATPVTGYMRNADGTIKRDPLTNQMMVDPATPKLETTKVETTLGKTAVSEAAKAAKPMSLDEKLEKMAKINLTAETFRDGTQVSSTEITPFAKDVLNEYMKSDAKLTMKDAFARVVDRYDLDAVGFPVSRVTTDKLTPVAKPADIKRDLVQSINKTVAKVSPKTTTTKELAKAQADAGSVTESFPSRTESFTQRQDYQDNVNSYESQGYSSSAATQAGANKTRADDRAMVQTGDYSGDTVAVTDSSGNAITSAGGVVTSNSNSTSKGLAIAAERAQREADNSTDSRVICTELYRQGKLSLDLYRMDVLYTARNLPKILVRGYHYWAIPMVPILRKNKIVCDIFQYLTLKRAEEIAHIMNPIKYPKTTISGKVIKNVGEVICYAIGLFVKQKDYTVLYNEKSV